MTQIHQSTIIDIENIYQGIINRDRYSLSKALTLVESSTEDSQIASIKLIDKCIGISGNSRRISISGSPGVGKSTMIESIGMHAIGLGEKLAVLAIDPSSTISKGSIMGDKTRMEKLSKNENAFIRPSPTSGSLGGVAKHTFESIVLCEAAGYDTIILETVGVGQSETLAHELTDIFILLVAPGGGDELQGIKRGIVELADIIVINKSEEERKSLSDQSFNAYSNATHLFPTKASGYPSTILKASALQGNGIENIWDAIDKFFKIVLGNGYLIEKRNNQNVNWARYCMKDAFVKQLENNNSLKMQFEELLNQVEKGIIPPYKAADIFMDGVKEMRK